MKTFIFIFLTLMTISFSCQKEKLIENFVLDSSIGIFIINSSGHDLLDTNTENHIETSSIKIYNIIDGIPIEVNNPRHYYSKGFFISDEKIDGKFILQLSLNTTNSIRHGTFETTTLLKLSSNDTDTLTCQFHKTINSLICKKVVYNGSAVWEWNSDRIITIKK